MCANAAAIGSTEINYRRYHQFVPPDSIECLAR
jgi:hypothetical protein